VGDRFKRAIYSIFMLGKTSELSRYDVVLFTEPLYPYNLMLLRYLKLLTRTNIIVYSHIPRINNRLYYLPIKGAFPVLISGEIARTFADSIATKVGFVPPGIDINKLYPMNIDKKWDLLYVGHLFREKGLMLLLQAMKWLKNNGSPLKLKIIHTPSYGEKLYRRYIRENELTNVDIERAIITDYISVYNSARVFVYPGISYNRVTTTPLTILEASACGLPLVCTSLYRHIGLPNIIFTGHEVKSLAGALLQASSISNPKTCYEAVAIIREKYSLTNMGNMAESFFTGVLNGK
jgi:glycosyltransferase involved in cell wall biosynthesis